MRLVWPLAMLSYHDMMDACFSAIKIGSTFQVHNKWCILPTGILLRDKLHLFPKCNSSLVKSRGHLLRLITKPDLFQACRFFSPLFVDLWDCLSKNYEQWKELSRERMLTIKHRWCRVKFLTMSVSVVQTSVFGKRGVHWRRTHIFD